MPGDYMTCMEMVGEWCWDFYGAYDQKNIENPTGSQQLEMLESFAEAGGMIMQNT